VGSVDVEGRELPAGGGYEEFYERIGALVCGSSTYEFVLGHSSEWPYEGKPTWVPSSRELRRPADEGADGRIANADCSELYAEVIAAGERAICGSSAAATSPPSSPAPGCSTS
jgi:hypothetical protein